MPTVSRKLLPEMPAGAALTAIGILCLFLSFGCLLEPTKVWKLANGAVILTTAANAPPVGKVVRLQTLSARQYQKVTLLALSLLASGSGWALIRRKAGSSPPPVTITNIKEKWSKLSLQQQQLFLGQIQGKEKSQSPAPPLTSASTPPTPTTSPTPQSSISTSTSTRYIEAHYLYTQGETLDRAVARIWKLEIGTAEHEKAKQEFTRWLRR